MSPAGHPPRQSPLPRCAGVLVPVFSLRHPSDCGIGDIRALARFCRWARNLGLRFVQILPVSETGNDPSPYNAISSRALDPLYLDASPAALPELAPARAAEILGRHNAPALRRAPRVNYPAVRALKRELAAAAFDGFRALPDAHPLRAEFERFAKAEAEWLDGYALFRALMDLNNGSECRDLWPAPQREPRTAREWAAALPADERAAFERKELFFKYLQWRLFGQWEALKAECGRMGLRLMGDIPFGVGYHSADVFTWPGQFDLDWSGGAPPERVFRCDPFTERWGQNWGIPLYRWDVMEADNFSWWRGRVKTAGRIMGAFRIDHILGFYRIYRFPWRPERNDEFTCLSGEEARERTGGRLPGFHPREDWPPENAEQNRRDGETRLRAVLDAAGDTWVVGENLGFVPEYMTPHLASLGIPGIIIPFWTKRHDGSVLPGGEYPEASMVTWGTHDHETVAAIWEEGRLRLPGHEGSIEAAELMADFSGIPRERLASRIRPEDHARILGAALESRSALAVFLITDLLCRTERINVPGSVGAANWSWRLPFDADALASRQEAARFTAVLPALLRGSGRAPA